MSTIKTWVNVFRDQYDPTMLYTSKSYGSKDDAMEAVRPHMKGRYIGTIDIGLQLSPVHVAPKKKKRKDNVPPVFGMSDTPETKEFLKDLEVKLAKIIYAIPYQSNK